MFRAGTRRRDIRRRNAVSVRYHRRRTVSELLLSRKFEGIRILKQLESKTGHLTC